jgi:Sec-independent protein secretion pathway component TatC
VPMIVLYELSILLAVAFGRSSEPASDHVISAEG